MGVACWISKAKRAHSHDHALAHSQTHTRVHTHEHALLHAHTLKRALSKKCISSCFSMATVVTWTRLNVTLCVHCLSCCLFLHSLRIQCVVVAFQPVVLRYIIKAKHANQCSFISQLTHLLRILISVVQEFFIHNLSQPPSCTFSS